MIDKSNHAKALLSGSKYLRKSDISVKLKEGREKEYPDRFWNVTLSSKTNSDTKWIQESSFDVDRIEEAIAHSILFQVIDNHYEECNIPPNITKHWKYYKIETTESIDREDRSHACSEYKILLSNGWTLDYEDSASYCFEYSLCKIPNQYFRMIEGGVPYKWDYRNVEKPSIDDYPFFMYKDNLFKTTYYVPSQKCICGNSDSYRNSHTGENSIKIEVWDVKVIEKDEILFDGNKLIYKNKIVECSNEMINDLKYLYPEKSTINRIKKIFPGGKTLNTSTFHSKI